jgi:acyl carrier protein
VTEAAGPVLRILTELMPGAEITISSPLRDGGLDSLATARLWFELRREFGVDLPVTWLGRCGTAGDLVARVAAELGEPGEGAPGVVADVAARYEPFPLTDLQQAYLLAKDPELNDDPIGCHVYREFRFDDLDVGQLTAAWRQVVDRHDVLRTVLTGDGRQRIQQEVPVPVIPVHDARDGAVEAVRERLSHRRYEPRDYPLYSVEVTRGPARSAVVHLSIDALLVDGHGLALILDDWWRFYLDPDAEPPTSPLTVRDCVTALAAEQHTAGYREHLAYWARRLADLPPGPDLGPAQVGRTGRRVALTGSLSRRQWGVLRNLAAAWEVSPTALVLTLFAEAFGWQRDRTRCTLVLTTNDRARLPREAGAHLQHRPAGRQHPGPAAAGGCAAHAPAVVGGPRTCRGVGRRRAAAVAGPRPCRGAAGVAGRLHQPHRHRTRG